LRGYAAANESARLRLALQALEVRAFGCLLEELGACALPDDQHINTLARMSAIAQACLDPDHSARPGMAELTQQLTTW